MFAFTQKSLARTRFAGSRAVVPKTHTRFARDRACLFRAWAHVANVAIAYADDVSGLSDERRPILNLPFPQHIDLSELIPIVNIFRFSGIRTDLQFSSFTRYPYLH